ncbi:MAG: NUDIX hydrolase [Candidatus Saccharibacteria bacterium]|nr:NUDIX hydrolase [Candidatus Saccharibacteria bacterium]
MLNSRQNSQITFPVTATATEKALPWKLLAEFSDQDLGFYRLEPKPDKFRYSVRVVLFNSQRQICIIKSLKYGYFQIPGGGVESGESLETALRRETAEEAGYTIANFAPLGAIIEHRESTEHQYPWRGQISFVFTAKANQVVKTHYTGSEISEDFTPIWVDLDFVIDELGHKDQHPTGYSAAFATRRDLIITKTAQSLIQSRNLTI